MAHFKPDKRPAEAGFTLIEVLIALAVVSVVLATVGRLAGESVNAALALRERTCALWVAEDRFALDQMIPDASQTGANSGTRALAGVDWFWTQRVTAGPMPSLRRVDIEVASSAGGAPLAQLTGLLRIRP